MSEVVIRLIAVFIFVSAICPAKVTAFVDFVVASAAAVVIASWNFDVVCKLAELKACAADP